jgi:hypothetical protein
MVLPSWAECEVQCALYDPTNEMKTHVDTLGVVLMIDNPLLARLRIGYRFMVVKVAQ